MKIDYILLAAGQGTRLWPITETIPKTMVRVLEKPLLEWMVENIYPNANKIIIVVGVFKEKIIEHFEKSKYMDKIEFVVQEKQLGTAHAPLCAEGKVTTPYFAVLAADSFWAPEFYLMFNKAVEKNIPFLVGAKVEDGERFGVIETNEKQLVKIVEKPKNAKNCLANTSAYFVPKSFFQNLKTLKPSSRGELEVTDSLTEFAASNAMEVLEFNGFWTDVGYFWHLLDANQYALEHLMESKIEGELDPRVDVNGKLFVGKGSKIVAPCRIDGNVYIGENCWVGPFALLKDCTIESNCGIGSSEVKRSIIMRDTKAFHFSHLADCVICEDVNFGAGAHSANLRLDKKHVPVEMKDKKVDSGKRKLGCVIGAKSNLGCNAVISPGVLVGSKAAIYPNVLVKKNVKSGEVVKTNN
ncbi:MAG: sugar phosphate nucleotidyltransferase [Candidatus Micrarchaeota archaeon]|nr:sugar phosphate nucleotidyltransferase [Candidatus Micrarchaeota archaeon]